MAAHAMSVWKVPTLFFGPAIRSYQCRILWYAVAGLHLCHAVPADRQAGSCSTCLGDATFLLFSHFPTCQHVFDHRSDAVSAWIIPSLKLRQNVWLDVAVAVHVPAGSMLDSKMFRLLHLCLQRFQWRYLLHQESQSLHNLCCWRAALWVWVPTVLDQGCKPNWAAATKTDWRRFQPGHQV